MLPKQARPQARSWSPGPTRPHRYRRRRNRRFACPREQNRYEPASAVGYPGWKLEWVAQKTSHPSEVVEAPLCLEAVADFKRIVEPPGRASDYSRPCHSSGDGPLLIHQSVREGSWGARLDAGSPLLMADAPRQRHSLRRSSAPSAPQIAHWLRPTEVQEGVDLRRLGRT